MIHKLFELSVVVPELDRFPAKLSMLVSPSSDVRIRFRQRGDDPGIVLFAMITTTQRKLEVAYAGIVVGSRNCLSSSPNKSSSTPCETCPGDSR
ncbi:unnamed protein product [Linum trigynum]|uniref:Uncharacterized protein n=1 Tax=Linum trigynum TaxID=586398 RepID=A0AAV2E6G3_9ROSI